MRGGRGGDEGKGGRERGGGEEERGEEGGRGGRGMGEAKARSKPISGFTRSVSILKPARSSKSLRG